MRGEGVGRMSEAQKGVTKKFELESTERQGCRTAGMAEWQSCNLQSDRACSLQELELQMSVLNRKKKMQNNSLAINEQQKLLKNID